MAAPGVAMGWKGFILVETDDAFLPFTSFDLTEKDQTIPAGDVHGGGIAGQTTAGFASETSAADGQLSYDGGISGNIYAGTGSYGTAFRRLISKCVDYTDRLCGFETATPLKISPGGATVNTKKAFQYPGDDTIDGIDGGSSRSIHRCVVSSMSINGGTGGLSTFSANLISSTRKEIDVTPSVADLEYETAGADLGENNPVPWHKTDLAVDSTIGETLLEERITGFTINVDNQSIPVYTFNRARTIRDVYQSQIIVTGTFDYYAANGEFGDLSKAFGSAGSPAIVATFGIGGGAPIILTIPFVVLDVKPIPGGGNNELIYRNVSWRGLAADPGTLGAINLT